MIFFSIIIEFTPKPDLINISLTHYMVNKKIIHVDFKVDF